MSKDAKEAGGGPAITKLFDAIRRCDLPAAGAAVSALIDEAAVAAAPDEALAEARRKAAAALAGPARADLVLWMVASWMAALQPSGHPLGCECATLRRSPDGLAWCCGDLQRLRRMLDDVLCP